MTRTRVLGAIVLVGIVARLGAAIVMGNGVEPLPGIFDQVSYHTLAVRLLAGHGFTFEAFWWPYTPAGEPTAHWSYLYTGMLAAIYGVVGVTPIVPRIIQAIVVGFAMPWLGFRIATRLFGESGEAEVMGLVAAAWTGLYGYFIYYSVALLTEPYFFIVVLWTLDCGLRLMQSKEKPAVRSWLELGLAISIAGMLRQVFLLFVPFLFLWLLVVWFTRTDANAVHRFKAALVQTVRGGLIAGGLMACLFLPITIYNYTQFNRFVLLNTNAGFAFFWANHPIYGDQFYELLPESMGTYGDLIPVELHGLNEAELDAALLQRGIGFVLADPARYVRLSLTRIPAFFRFWPSADSSMISNLTRVFSFGVALPFMLVGMGLWIRDAIRRAVDWRTGGLLLSFAVIYSLIHLLSWSLIRYRLPVDLVLLAFAARALWPLLSVARIRWLPQLITAG